MAAISQAPQARHVTRTVRKIVILAWREHSGRREVLVDSAVEEPVEGTEE